jgi:hypothetical protein
MLFTHAEIFFAATWKLGIQEEWDGPYGFMTIHTAGPAGKV